MVLIIQVAGALFGLFLIYLTFLQYKRHEFKASEFLIWAVIWVLFIIVSLFPRILESIVESLKLQRIMDLFTITGFLFLVLLTFYNYFTLRKNNRKLEKIVREIALKEANIPKKSK